MFQVVQVILATKMSQPALRVVSRIALQRVATPVPRTISRLDALKSALVETDARIEAAWTLLWRDATEVGRLDWPAFAARVQALLMDLDGASELLTAMISLSPARECELSDRARLVEERRHHVNRWLKQIGQPW
jgi:hypothetical protein